MKLIPLLLLTLLLTGSKSYAPQDKYIGSWMWVKSVFSNRGGGSTATPATTNRTATVEIYSDLRMRYFINDTIACEGTFVFDDGSDTHSSDNLQKNCRLGSAHLKNDTLVFFRYLGCPSKTNYFVKIKE